MKFKTTLLVLACLVAGSSAFATAFTPKDSVGVERKGKNVLVLHKVESGETLYSLARRYHASVSKIKSQNPGMADALRMGQIVKVPFSGGNTETTEATASSGAVSGGKTHVVANGEGLYSIARKYNISASNLRKWNHLSSDNLRIGQELIVSSGGAPEKTTETTVTSTPVTEKTAPAAGGKTHVVANGEGLYSIARKYKTSVQKLREWNDLRSDNITFGQELIVAAPQEEQPAPAIAKAEPVKTTPTEKPTEKVTTVAEPKPNAVDATATAMISPAATKSADSIGNKEEERAAEKAAPLVINNSGYVKTVESGMAEAITEGSNSDLFLALHRTAPVGTIMQIRNEMNDQSVFVKVVGKLPDTGDNDKVIVKISKRAYERLAAVDKRFRVQVSYMPQ